MVPSTRLKRPPPKKDCPGKGLARKQHTGARDGTPQQHDAQRDGGPGEGMKEAIPHHVDLLIDERVTQHAVGEHVVQLQDLVKKDAIHEAAHADAENRAGGEQRTRCLFRNHASGSRVDAAVRRCCGFGVLFVVSGSGDIKPGDARCSSRTAAVRMGTGAVTRSSVCRKWPSKRPARRWRPPLELHTVQPNAAVEHRAALETPRIRDSRRTQRPPWAGWIGVQSVTPWDARKALAVVGEVRCGR